MPELDLGAGRRVVYDVAGDGPAVVLSHASLVDRAMWTDQLNALSRHFRVIAFDREGYGDSSPAPPSVRFGHELLEVLDALGLDRAALIGCSMGGGYSLDATLSAPDRVSALVLICSGIPGYEWPDEMQDEVRPLLTAAVPVERLSGYTAHTAEEVRDDDIAAMAEMQARYMAVGPGRTPSVYDAEVWAEVLEMTRRGFARLWREPAYEEIPPDPPLLTRLGEVKTPTLVINGRSDVRFIQALSDMLAGGIPDVTRIDLDDTAHLPPVEHPNEVNAALIEFLDATLWY